MAQHEASQLRPDMVRARQRGAVYARPLLSSGDVARQEFVVEKTNIDELVTSS